MRIAHTKTGWVLGMTSVGVSAWAGTPAAAPPQEPVGFITGAVVGGLAAGPFGVVVGAGLGTWLGNRVHRAGEAKRAEVRAAALETDKRQLQSEKAVLVAQTGNLSQTNRELSARVDALTQTEEPAQSDNEATADDEAAAMLNGLSGDVLFRTGSAEISPDMTAGIEVLADAVAKSPAIKVKLDGYADPRGGEAINLKLSQARADAVRDVFLAAGVEASALEITAYGKSRSVAADSDGYALERRVRLTLEVDGSAAVARTDGK